MQNTFSKIVVVHKVDEVLYDLLKEKLKNQVVFYKKLADLPNPDDLVKGDQSGQVSTRSNNTMSIIWNADTKYLLEVIIL